MLTPTEKRAITCICTGVSAENESARWPEREPLVVLDFVDTYLQIRRQLLGGDVERFAANGGGRYDLQLYDGRTFAKAGFVWSYSGQRPGSPIINFKFPEIGQNSADICYSEGFTLNLLFAKQGTNLGIDVPEGWESWQEPANALPTRQWAVYHGIRVDTGLSQEVTAGIQQWRQLWQIP